MKLNHIDHNNEREPFWYLFFRNNHSSKQMYETLNYLESSAYTNSIRNHKVLSKDTINKIIEETNFPKDKYKYLYDVRNMIFINLLAFNLKRYDKKKENITSLENYVH